MKKTLLAACQPCFTNPRSIGRKPMSGCLSKIFDTALPMRIVPVALIGHTCFRKNPFCCYAGVQA
jgi:hypothetical protein